MFRSVILKKYFMIPLLQRLMSLWVNKADLAAWLNDWRFFFILGFGRSGTAFLANILDQAEGAYVFHEPVLEDFYSHARAHYSPKYAENYMEWFRKKEMYLRIGHISPPGIYGEVNGTLRCHVRAIQKSFPNPVIIHLVRDGRDVVRSSMSRRTMTWKNPFSMSMHPEKTDPWFGNWKSMDRFARICWFWQEENRRLRTAIGKSVQFEKILKDYKYFSDNVLEVCGIQIEKRKWETYVNTPRNVTKEFAMPNWDNWKVDQQRTFRKICGEEMDAIGYSF